MALRGLLALLREGLGLVFKQQRVRAGRRSQVPPSSLTLPLQLMQHATSQISSAPMETRIPSSVNH